MVFYHTNKIIPMTDDTHNRWTVTHLDTTKFTVTVSDNLAKRKKTYHIPYLTHAVVKDRMLMAATSFNKIMEIDLSNGSRRFI
jgi:hypothetical protein